MSCCKMHGALRRAGAARCVAPEADIVFARRFPRIEFVGRFSDQTLVGKRLAVRRADDDDMFKKAACCPRSFRSQAEPIHGR